MKPNAELAYRVLDHIDAHPEQWNQGLYIGEVECGTVACFAGWAVLLSGATPKFYGYHGSTATVAFGPRHYSAPELAEQLLGASRWVDEGDEDERDLFDQDNSREDLGRLVFEIFGPRPERSDDGPDHSPDACRVLRGERCSRCVGLFGPAIEMQPPPCADHEANELSCPVCSAQRRAFYAALGREDGATS